MFLNVIFLWWLNYKYKKMGVYEDNEVAPPALLKNLKKKWKWVELLARTLENSHQTPFLCPHN